MNNLININNENSNQPVSAKELYLGLGLAKDKFARWYPTNIIENGFFNENEDWVGLDIMSNGNESKDFAISIDFAKHIAMMARTEKSHEYRNYFISIEKKFKEIAKPQSIEDLIIMQAQSMKDMKQQLNEVNHNALSAKSEAIEAKEDVQTIRDVIIINSKKEWRDMANKVLKGIGYKTGDYQKPKEDSYRSLDKRAGCDLNKRLNNLKVRAMDQCWSNTKIKALCNLDVIAEDKKLTEIYISIIKEMAITNKVSFK